MLEAKLYQMQVEAQDAENAARRGEKSKIGFGGETIRNYVLHPDRFAKDTRTGHRETNPDAVIDGDLHAVHRKLPAVEHRGMSLAPVRAARRPAIPSRPPAGCTERGRP